MEDRCIYTDRSRRPPHPVGHSDLQVEVQAVVGALHVELQLKSG